MTEAEPSRLGEELRGLRRLSGQSLRTVGEAVGFSAAYLLKLENGEVVSPSPHALRALSTHFAVSYVALMALAGYATADEELAREPSGVLADAVAGQPMTAEEQRAVAAFLVSLRGMQP
jgi:transcriptional regulator with XRE-family HTH domain